MNQIKLGTDGWTEAARDLADIRNVAIAADTELRTLRDVEMAWVAGGDGAPVWPY